MSAQRLRKGAVDQGISSVDVRGHSLIAGIAVERESGEIPHTGLDDRSAGSAGHGTSLELVKGHSAVTPAPAFRKRVHLLDLHCSGFQTTRAVPAARNRMAQRID